MYANIPDYENSSPNFIEYTELVHDIPGVFHTMCASELLADVLPNCAGCNARFDNRLCSPQVIPCGHTFCLKCLSKEKQRKRRKCPACDVKYKTFKTNIAFEDAVTKVRVRREALDAATHRCDECERRAPLQKMRRCRTCEKQLLEMLGTNAALSSVMCLECCVDRHNGHDMVPASGEGIVPPTQRQQKKLSSSQPTLRVPLLLDAAANMRLFNGMLTPVNSSHGSMRSNGVLAPAGATRGRLPVTPELPESPQSHSHSPQPEIIVEDMPMYNAPQSSVMVSRRGLAHTMVRRLSQLMGRTEVKERRPSTEDSSGISSQEEEDEHGERVDLEELYACLSEVSRNSIRAGGSLSLPRGRAPSLPFTEARCTAIRSTASATSAPSNYANAGESVSSRRSRGLLLAGAPATNYANLCHSRSVECLDRAGYEYVARQ